MRVSGYQFFGDSGEFWKKKQIAYVVNDRISVI